MQLCGGIMVGDQSILTIPIPQNIKKKKKKKTPHCVTCFESQKETLHFKMCILVRRR